MKNIHILPTDNPSRLCLSNNSILTIIEEANYTFSHIQSVNIYITSDEEIKEWFIVNGTNGYSMPLKYSVMFPKDKFPNGHDKTKLSLLSIVLTTDQDLIAEGVQPIPDEFLEWFVKNPSCEEVEIEEYFVHKINTTIFIPPLKKHTVIIPKEEPKNPLTCEHFTKTIGCIKDICSCNTEPKKGPFKHIGRVISEDENYLDSFGVTKSEFEVHRDFDKQETLEEAELTKFALSEAKKWVGEDNYHKIATYATAISVGAKWQAKRSYSKEEVKKLAFDFYYDMSHKMKVPENLISENIDNVDAWQKENKDKYSKEDLKLLIDYTRRWGYQSSDDYILSKWFEQFKKK